MSFKDIGVTTLTFWGHVTSSVTWPLDSQYEVSYRWSIWTDRLSRTVFEILSFKGIGVTTLTFGVQPMLKAEKLTAHASYHVTYRKKVKTTTYLESPTPIWLFTITLYGVPMKNKRYLLMRPLMLKAKSSENFPGPDPKLPNFGGFQDLGVRR